MVCVDSLSLLQETVQDIFTRLKPDNSNEVRLVDLLVDPVALEYLDSLHSYRLPVSGHCTHCSHSPSHSTQWAQHTEAMCCVAVSCTVPMLCLCLPLQDLQAAFRPPSAETETD